MDTALNNSIMMPFPSEDIHVPVDNQFGFRQPLLCYLKKNANPKILLKLMQISKYFCFPEFPFSVVKNAYFSDDIQADCFFDGNGCTFVDVQYATRMLWLTEKLYIENYKNLKFYLSLIPKIAVCDIILLVIFKQIITIDEFQHFNCFEIQECCIVGTIVTTSDGKILPLEDIIPAFPKIHYLDFHYSDESAFTATPESTKNVIDALTKSHICTVLLNGIPETFDFDAFSIFMEENPKKLFVLHFRDNISAEYSQMLQAYLDKIIEKGFINPIGINFIAQTSQSWDTVCNYLNTIKWNGTNL